MIFSSLQALKPKNPWKTWLRSFKELQNCFRN